jgi:branched-chain amino acid transport system substrate-binding protein
MKSKRTVTRNSAEKSTKKAAEGSAAKTVGGGITRREAISKMGWAGVGVAAVVIIGAGGYLAYEATKPSPTSSSTTSSTSSSTSTTPVITSSSATGPSQIKMGTVLPLSGDLASFGQAIIYGMKTAITDFNNLGGVELNGTRVPINHVVYDDASNLTNTASLAAQLCISDNVDVLVHGNSGPTAGAASVQADRYHVPWVGGAPWEPWWAQGPFKYAWAILWRIGTPAAGYPTGYTLADAYSGVTQQWSSQTNTNVGILASSDPDGTGFYDAFPGVLKGIGYTVLDPLDYPANTTDFSSVITKWKSDDIDIVWANTPGPDFGVFWRQAKELNFRPKIAICGKGSDFYLDINAWGNNLPLGVCQEAEWDPSWGGVPVKGSSTTPQSLLAGWTAATGQPLNQSIAYGYATVQIAADAITRAGTLDKDSVNTAISETNDSFMTGPIKFTSTHDSPGVVTISQWQPGTGTQFNWIQPIVYSQVSKFPATASMVFPLPAWS